MCGVVGDAVEHGFAVGAICRRQKTSEVDPAGHFAGFWIDACDAIGVKDVGVDLPMNVFEFVEEYDGLPRSFTTMWRVSCTVTGSRKCNVAVPSEAIRLYRPG